MAQISFFRDEFDKKVFFAHFRFILKKDVPFFTLNMIAFIAINLIFPLYFNQPGNYDIQFIAFFILPLAPVLFNFKYLTGEAESDLILGLPQSKRSIFYARFSAGLITLVMPMVAVYYIISPIFGVFLPTSNFILCEYFSSIAIYLISMVFFYIFAVFCCMHAGRLFYTVAYYVTLTVLPTIFINFAVKDITFSLFGFVKDMNYLASNGALGWKVPEWVTLINNSWFLLPAVPGNIINRVFFIGNYPAQYLVQLIMIVLLSFIFTILAERIHYKRRGDQTQHIEVFKYMTALLAGVLALSLGYILTGLMNQYISELKNYLSILLFVGISIVLYLITAVAFRGNFKIGFKRLAGYIGVLAGYGLIALFISTQCFGRIYYIPSVNDIASVEYYFPYNKNGYDILTNSGNIKVLKSIGSIYSINLKTDADKTAAVDLQNQIINIYKKDKESLEPGIPDNKDTDGKTEIKSVYESDGLEVASNDFKVYIKYKMKNGHILLRYYNVNARNIDSQAAAMLSTPSFRDECSEINLNYINCDLYNSSQMVEVSDLTGKRKVPLSFDSKYNKKFLQLIHDYYDDDIKLNVPINKKDKNNIYMTVDAYSLDNFAVYPFINAIARFGIKEYSQEKTYIPYRLLITPSHKKLTKDLNDHQVFTALKNYHE